MFEKKDMLFAWLEGIVHEVGYLASWLPGKHDANPGIGSFNSWQFMIILAPLNLVEGGLCYRYQHSHPMFAMVPSLG